MTPIRCLACFSVLGVTFNSICSAMYTSSSCQDTGIKNPRPEIFPKKWMLFILTQMDAQYLVRLYRPSKREKQTFVAHARPLEVVASAEHNLMIKSQTIQ